MAGTDIAVKKYVVRLSAEEREQLQALIRKGKSPAKRLLKARILLKADVSDAGEGWSDSARRQQGQLQTPAVEEGVTSNEEGVGPIATKRREYGINLPAGACVDDLDLQLHGASRGFHLPQISRGGRDIGRIDENGHTGRCWQ